jgi:hypothetical protein
MVKPPGAGTVQSLAGVTPATAATNWLGMSLLPDQPPSSVKPKLSAEERRTRQEDRSRQSACARHRPQAGRPGIITSADIGVALWMPATNVVNSREGNVALLQAAAARLGLPS